MRKKLFRKKVNGATSEVIFIQNCLFCKGVCRFMDYSLVLYVVLFSVHNFDINYNK